MELSFWVEGGMHGTTSTHLAMDIELYGYLTMLTSAIEPEPSVYLHAAGQTYQLEFVGDLGSSPDPQRALPRMGPDWVVHVRGDLRDDPEGPRIRVVYLEYPMAEKLEE